MFCQQRGSSGTAVVFSAMRHGLTLAETIVALVLIVAVILFILIGIPHPHHRHQARLVICLSNLRQMGIANLEYAHENKEFIPRGGARMHWAIPAAEQMKLVEKDQYVDVNELPVNDFKVFQCPAGTRTQGTPFLDYVGNTFDTEMGAENDWQEMREPTKLDIWKHPSKVLYIGDAALESGIDADGANMNGNLKRFRENKQLDRMSVFNPSQIQTSPNRHAGTKIHFDRFAQRTTEQWLRMYGVDDAVKDKK